MGTIEKGTGAVVLWDEEAREILALLPDGDAKTLLSRKIAEAGIVMLALHGLLDALPEGHAYKGLWPEIGQLDLTTYEGVVALEEVLKADDGEVWDDVHWLNETLVAHHVPTGQEVRAAAV